MGLATAVGQPEVAGRCLLGEYHRADNLPGDLPQGRIAAFMTGEIYPGEADSVGAGMIVDGKVSQLLVAGP
jgi:hypothetical protein